MITVKQRLLNRKRNLKVLCSSGDLKKNSFDSLRYELWGSFGLSLQWYLNLLSTYCEEGFSVIEYATLYQDRAIKSEAFSVPGALIFNLTQIMAFLKQLCHSYTCTHKKQRIADAGY